MRFSFCLSLCLCLVTGSQSIQAQDIYPDEGWWRPDGSSGRAFLMERQGDVTFITAVHYSSSGEPEWLGIVASYEPADSDQETIGTLTGDVFRAENGDCIGCAATQATVTDSIQSPVTIMFHSNRNATLEWPNETLELSRFYWSYENNLQQMTGKWLLVTMQANAQPIANIVSVVLDGELASVLNEEQELLGAFMLDEGDLMLSMAELNQDIPVIVPENKRFYAGSRSTQSDSVVGVRIDDLPVVLSEDVVSGESVWLVNSNGETSAIFVDGNGSPVLVNIESVAHTTIDGIDYVSVSASGIPAYTMTVAQEDIDLLNARPRASRDFAGGTTSAVAGSTLGFGEDIGFNSRSNGSCLDTGGFGYWPPGPDCPEDTAKTGNFPLKPVASGESCETGLGVIGYFVNGVSVFNWGDGQSYNNQRVWYQRAARAEVYDLDICDGHAANGDYHHHFYSDCLADTVGDSADKHSPIYGFAADGFPIHGPWHDQGMLTKSAWVARDYNDPADVYGCGGSGARSCVMVDEFNPALGTTQASSSGPLTSAQITSMSGNTFTATSGFYYQDFYYDPALTAAGVEYLDEHSGHDHDGIGYHYHLPVEMNGDDRLVSTFPDTIGPRFYGVITDNAISNCGGPAGGGPG